MPSTQQCLTKRIENLKVRVYNWLYEDAVTGYTKAQLILDILSLFI